MIRVQRMLFLLVSAVLLLGTASSALGRIQPDAPPPIYYLTSTILPPDQLQYQAQALDINTRVIARLGRPLPLDNRLFDQVAWSPDRQWVALSGESSGLYLAGIARGQVEPIMIQGLVDSPMAWSPDGVRLAYVALAEDDLIQFEGQLALWVYDRADGSRRQLARDPAQYARLDWSPDGTRLAYVSFDGTTQTINLIEWLPDSKQTVLVTDANDPAWSPDGAWIAYYALQGADQEIFVIRPDGTEGRPLTRNHLQDVLPTWSPDGRWLSYLSVRGSDLDIVALPTACLTDPAACTPHILTANDQIDSPFMWSPDGRYLLYRTFPPGLPPQWLLLDTTCLDTAAGCDEAASHPLPLPSDESALALVWGAG